ncbi:hypothetical protein SQ03_01010 [Methylobacterium platani JCM 14648]|nr:hypothetical protein SQ03_01010 [Methylobacterium platani JCM 14648]
MLLSASMRAIDRIGCGKRAGKHPRKAANAAINRIYDIPREVCEGVLTPGDAALEMLRIEITLKRRAPQPATAPAAETSSDAVREPHEPIVHYDPDPPVIVPMDFHDSPEDRAAVRKAREARDA